MADFEFVSPQELEQPESQNVTSSTPNAPQPQPSSQMEPSNVGFEFTPPTQDNQSMTKFNQQPLTKFTQSTEQTQAPDTELSATEHAKLFGESLLDRAIAAGKSAFYGAIEQLGGATEALGKTGVLPGGKGIYDKYLSKNVQGLTQKVHEAQQEQEEDYGFTAQAGHLAGTLGALAPFGGTFKALGTGIPRAMGKLMPGMPFTASTIGTSLGGAAQGGLTGAIQPQFDDDTTSPLNMKQMGAGAAIGAVLGPALNAIPLLKHYKRSDEVSQTAANKLVRKLSPKVANAKTAKEAEGYAIRAVKKVRNKLEKVESSLWNPLMKKAGNVKVPKTNLSSLKEQIEAAELPATYKNRLIKGLDNIKNFKGLKEFRSVVRKVKEDINKRSQKGTEYRFVKEDIDDIYNQTTLSMRNSLKDENLKLFEKANAFTREKNKLLEDGGKQFKESLLDDGAAIKYINKLMSEKGGAVATKKIQGLGKDLNTVRAKILRDTIYNSFDDNVFNLSKFTQKISQNPNLEAVMGPHYRALKGLEETVLPYITPPQVGFSRNLEGHSVIFKVANNILRMIQNTGTLKGGLIKAGYITRNDRVKDYISSKMMDKLISLGVVLKRINDNEVLITTEDKENDNE